MHESKITTVQNILPASEYSSLIRALNRGIYLDTEIIEIVMSRPTIDFIKLNEVMGTFYEEIVKRANQNLFSLFTGAASSERVCRLIDGNFYSLSNELLSTLIVNVGHVNPAGLAGIIAKSRDYSGRTAFFYADHPQDRMRIKMLIQIFGRRAPGGADFTDSLLECLAVKAGNFGTAFEWIRGRSSFVLNEILDVLGDNKIGLKKFAEAYILYFLQVGTDEDFAKFIKKLELYPDVLAGILNYKNQGTSILLEIAVSRADVGKVSVLAPHYAREDRHRLLSPEISFSMESALKKQTVVRVMASTAVSHCYSATVAVISAPSSLFAWATTPKPNDKGNNLER